MRCYKVTATVDGGTKTLTRYAGTNALAREKREALMEEFGVRKKDVEIEDAEIPTGKAELLEFVNKLCAQQDPEHSE